MKTRYTHSEDSLLLCRDFAVVLSLMQFLELKLIYQALDASLVLLNDVPQALNLQFPVIRPPHTAAKPQVTVLQHA